MPVQEGLVNTRDGQKRFPRQFLPKCTFNVGIVAMAHFGGGQNAPHEAAITPGSLSRNP